MSGSISGGCIAVIGEVDGKYVVIWPERGSFSTQIDWQPPELGWHRVNP
jgi:hypothetical protein